jgi:uncharacterized membrane protein YhfC
MPGIYVMAILTIGLAALLGITALNQLTPSGRQYYWLILAGLPLSLIVNRFIKTPILISLAAWAGIPLKLGLDAPLWFIVLIWMNAPIWEEAIKLLPMILPLTRGFLREPVSALWAGLALGMGFGLGEAAYLAYGIAQSPAYQQLPWYSFTGFAAERLIVTLGHGLLTSLAVLGVHYGKKRALFGYLVAVVLHALINLGPILVALKLIPAAIASVESDLAILVAFIIFQKCLLRAKKLTRIEPREIFYFER